MTFSLKIKIARTMTTVVADNTTPQGKLILVGNAILNETSPAPSKPGRKKWPWKQAEVASLKPERNK